MANKENTSDEGLRVSYDVKTYHEQIYRLYITAKGNIKNITIVCERLFQSYRANDIR